MSTPPPRRNSRVHELIELGEESETDKNLNKNSSNNYENNASPSTPRKDATGLRLASVAQLAMSPSGERWKKYDTLRPPPNLPRSDSILLPDLTEQPSEAPTSLLTEDWEDSNFGETHSNEERVKAIKRRNMFFVLMLIATGLATAVAGFLSDWAIEALYRFRFYVHAKAENPVGQFIIWLMFTLFSITTTILLTRVVSPEAAGSGIPEMKAIFSGTRLDGYLRFKVLITKLVGLVLVLGSGFSLGKEGPFAHVGCIIGKLISNVPLFGHIHKEGHIEPFLITLLGAALAGGVAATFGSPIGGVLFSIEVSATYYPLRNYWSAYVTSLASVLLFRYLFNLKNGDAGFAALLKTDQNTETDFGIVELFMFFVLGALCGLLAIFFIKLHAALSKRYRHFKEQYPQFASPYYLGIAVAVLTTVLTFPYAGFNFMAQPGLAATRDMYCINNHTVTTSCLHDPAETDAEWGWPIPSLLYFFVVRFFLTPLTMLLPIPAGLYTPLITAGAAIGRVVGEIMGAIFSGTVLDGGYIAPGVYAVVGGAALTGGITHTLSSAVIAFELTGQIYYIVPVLIAVSTSVFLAKKFSSLSIYDSISKDRGLRYLPDLAQSSYPVQAKDIMTKKIPYLTKDFYYDDIIKALSYGKRVVPVVESRETYLLVGQVEKVDLMEAAESFFSKQREIQTHLSVSHDSPDEVDVPQKVAVPLRSVPIQFLQSTGLSEIHLLFTTMHLEEAFVTDKGRLVGSIDRKALKNVIMKKDAFLTILSD